MDFLDLILCVYLAYKAFLTATGRSTINTSNEINGGQAFSFKCVLMSESQNYFQSSIQIKTHVNIFF